MRFFFLILIFVFSSLMIVAQSTNVYFGDESVFDIEDTTLSQVKKPFLDQNRLNVRFTAGTGFTSYGGGYMSSFAAPEIDYRLNKKFSFSVGTMMTTTTMPSFVNPERANSSFMENKMLSYYVFARGNYMVNEKFRLRSSVAFDVTPMNTQNSLAFGSFGFDYKIGENSFISADFVIDNVHHGNPAYSNSPFGPFDSRGIRPYGNSLFSDPFPQW
ncbi:MAG: hypothetical protein JXR36_06220 [Bacteroidales bacterium]|nr:hypothetical protein [Bacteroidales bacterium]